MKLRPHPFSATNSGPAQPDELRTRANWPLRIALLFVLTVLLAVWLPGLLTSPRTEAEKLLGTPLPVGATDVHVVQQQYFFNGVAWVSARLSRDDFDRLMTRMGFTPKPDLMAYWLSAFDGPGEPWWSSTHPAEGDGYFLPRGEVIMAAKHEGGRLFLKWSRS